jgi:hypothetical protein
LLISGLASRDPVLFADLDAVVVPSDFAAAFCREALGLRCTILPPLIDLGRLRAERTGPGHATFVDPTPGHGAFAFDRIADELGRRRPDIPLLVVEGQGTEATVAACGLDLRPHGNVFFLPPPADPRAFWSQTRILLLPALGWDDPTETVAGALANGIPIVASDLEAGTAHPRGLLLDEPADVNPQMSMDPNRYEVSEPELLRGLTLS